MPVSERRTLSSRPRSERSGHTPGAHRSIPESRPAELLGRVNELLRELGDEPVGREEPGALARAVCRELVETGGYPGSWVGSTTPAADRLRIVASAGLSVDEPREFAVDALSRVVREAMVPSAVEVSAARVRSARPPQPTPPGAEWLAVVPLVYGRRQRGLLGVYGERPDGPTELERQLLAAVGQVVAGRLHSIDTRQLLCGDRVTEATVCLYDPSFVLSAVARSLGTAVDYVGMATERDDGPELFLETDEPRDVDVLSTLSAVRTVREVSSTERATTFALTVVPRLPFSLLAENAVALRRLHAAPERARLVLVLPTDCDVRSVVALLESRYERVELRGRRDRDDRTPTVQEFAADVHHELTDRQQVALEAAHLNGYFEWPRPSDGTTVAETMGITRQTFHQHLRAAERRLVASYLRHYAESISSTE